MKTDTTNLRNALGRWACFLGAMLMVALMVPTIVMSQSPQPYVNLGTAGNFVILTKTGITTTGTTHITGDIGVSPIAATAMTGFSLSMDPSTTFSTSSLVTGKIYASDYTAPTPVKMTTAISDMATAYTDAAGRSNPNGTELYAGDLTLKTLTPGLYKWGTGVLISAGGVTLNGSGVYIFQISQDLTVANSAHITLSGGADAAYIFWQVGGKATIGTGAAMSGVILCQTEITFATGASLNGKALAQTQVTLQSNAITDVGNSAPAATGITLMGGNNQSGSISGVLVNPCVVTVKDGFGNPLSGKVVTFAITSFPSGATGQLLSVTTATTNSSGQASTVLTLGNKAGNYVVTATSVGLAGSPVTFTATATAATAVESGAAPLEFALSQNYPNPFNPSTKIQYSLEKAGVVSLKVYNVLGNKVATLVDSRQEAGSYSVSFNTNDRTVSLPSGVYFYRLEAGSFVSTKKLILMK